MNVRRGVWCVAASVLLGMGRMLLGMDHMLLGRNRMLLGMGRILLGMGRVLLGMGRLLLGRDRLLLGMDRMLLGRNRLLLGMGRVGMGRMLTVIRRARRVRMSVTCRRRIFRRVMVLRGKFLGLWWRRAGQRVLLPGQRLRIGTWICRRVAAISGVVDMRLGVDMRLETSHTTAGVVRHTVFHIRRATLRYGRMLWSFRVRAVRVAPVILTSS